VPARGNRVLRDAGKTARSLDALLWKM